MKKLLIVPALLALATAGCMHGADAGVMSGGRSMANGQEVELSAGGLTTGSPGLHHANIIEFGASRADVVAQLSAILGRPTSTGRNAECPSGPVDYAQFGPLQLNFEDGRFAGWVADRAGDPLLESYHGLSVGDRRSELDGDAEIDVDENSTLGTELSVNGIGALLEGPGPDAKVTTLFAGVTCFAR